MEVFRAGFESQIPQDFLGDLRGCKVRFYELDRHPSGNWETCFSYEEGYNQGDAERCPACGAFISALKWLPPYRVELDLYGKRFGDLAFGFGGDDLLVSQKFRQVYYEYSLAGLI